MPHPLLARFRRHRLLAILRTDDTQAALAIGRAVITGGFRLVEVTLTTPGADEVVSRLREAGEEVLVGCGTVLTPEAAQAAIEWGAQFLVSPNTDPQIVAVAREQGVLVIGGALTPSEVIAAWQMGVDLVKLFPVALLGGPAYLRALREPLPDIPLLPTGGIGEADYLAYLQLGATAVGVGRALFEPEEVVRRNWGVIAARASQWTMALAEEQFPDWLADPTPAT